MVKLHVPSFNELSFRQNLYADKATMAGFDDPFDFDETMWQNWFDKWIGREPERYYAYIQNESGDYVGDVNWHYNEKSGGGYYIGVVVKYEYRGNRYAEQALNLLIERAKEGGITELRNEFQISRLGAVKLHLKLGFGIVSEKIENGEKVVTFSKKLVNTCKIR